VLIYRAAMRDIDSNVPLELIGRGEICLSSVGEPTIVIEAINSMSNKVIFRAAERRAAERTSSASQQCYDMV